MSDFDPDYLPKELPKSAVLIGDKVAYAWAGNRPHDIHGLLIWHWCDYSVWRADMRKDPDYIPNPGWSPTGVQAHDFISADPLHLEPSIYWPSCCGIHGWIRNGTWVNA